MPKITFNPSEVAKSADVNYNFANTWNGNFMDDESIQFRHLDPTARGVTGSIVAFAGQSSAVPTGWFLCNGQSLSRSVNDDLFAVIGTIYGAPDNNTFQVPNLLGKIIAQLDANQGEFQNLGQVFGEKYHQLTVGELANHGHGVYDPGHDHQSTRDGQNVVTNGGSNNSTYYPANAQRVTWGDTRTSGSGTGIGIYGEGGNQAHNNIQPTMALNYIIKA